MTKTQRQRIRRAAAVIAISGPWKGMTMADQDICSNCGSSEHLLRDYLGFELVKPVCVDCLDDAFRAQFGLPPSEFRWKDYDKKKTPN